MANCLHTKPTCEGERQEVKKETIKKGFQNKTAKLQRKP